MLLQKCVQIAYIPIMLLGVFRIYIPCLFFVLMTQNLLYVDNFRGKVTLLIFSVVLEGRSTYSIIKERNT